MVTRSDIVNEALTWVGTPWHHHQGTKGAGVDCVQLVLKVAQNVGVVDGSVKIDNYEPLARGKFLVRHLERLLERVHVSNEFYQFTPGDILLMAANGLETHVGIVVDACHFVHACARRRRVVKCHGAGYGDMIRRVYKLPGVVDG